LKKRADILSRPGALLDPTLNTTFFFLNFICWG